MKTFFLSVLFGLVAMCSFNADAVMVCSGNDAGEAIFWYVGEPRPLFPSGMSVGEDIQCTLSGAEYSYLVSNFNVMKRTGGRQDLGTWRGEQAMFIIDNIWIR